MTQKNISCRRGCFTYMGSTMSVRTITKTSLNVMHHLTTVSLFCPFTETQRPEAWTEAAWTWDEYSQSRRKRFHFIWRVTSIRWGRERPNVKQGRTGWHLIDDDLWTHGSNTTCMHTLTHCTRVTSSSLSLALSFFFFWSFAMLADKAPISIRHVSFFVFSFFDSQTTMYSRVPALVRSC